MEQKHPHLKTRGEDVGFKNLLLADFEADTDGGTGFESLEFFAQVLVARLIHH